MLILREGSVTKGAQALSQSLMTSQKQTGVVHVVDVDDFYSFFESD